MTRRHCHAQDILRAQRVCRENRHERRINPAGQADNHRFEAAFADVIADAQRQRGEQLLLARRKFRWGERPTKFQIRDKNFLFKSFSHRDNFTARINHAAVAVEN